MSTTTQPGDVDEGAAFLGQVFTAMTRDAVHTENLLRSHLEDEALTWARHYLDLLDVLATATVIDNATQAALFEHQLRHPMALNAIDHLLTMRRIRTQPETAAQSLEGALT